LAVVVVTVVSAVSTVVVPRGVPVRLTRAVFILMRVGFDAVVKLVRQDDRQDHVMARYAPFSLLVLMATWLTLVLLGFTAIFWGLGVGSWAHAFEVSGSCLTTLGFEPVRGTVRHVAAFVEAGLGLLLLALLITYLPTMYAAFQRREVLVGLANMQAGSPPSGVVLLARFHAIRGLDALEEQVWQPWTIGFVDIEESHTSLSSLPFFRSPQPGRSWITAAGAVMDAASLLDSTVDAPRQAQGNLCVRAGFLALRRMADFYGIPYDPDPSRGDPISVTRQEWEAARDQLADAGVPLRLDVEEAWLDFTGWRVNYDAVLIALAGMVGAPPAPWSSDRALARHRPPLRRRHG
jgi:hypothetical protein